MNCRVFNREWGERYVTDVGSNADSMKDVAPIYLGIKEQGELNSWCLV